MSNRDNRRTVSARWPSLPSHEDTFDDLDRSLALDTEELLRSSLANRRALIDRSGRVITFKSGVAGSGSSESDENNDILAGLRDISAPALFGERDWSRSGGKRRHGEPSLGSSFGRPRLPDPWGHDDDHIHAPRTRRKHSRRSLGDDRPIFGKPHIPPAITPRYASSGTQTAPRPQSPVISTGNDGKPALDIEKPGTVQPVPSVISAPPAGSVPPVGSVPQPDATIGTGTSPVSLPQPVNPSKTGILPAPADKPSVPTPTTGLGSSTSPGVITAPVGTPPVTQPPAGGSSTLNPPGVQVEKPVQSNVPTTLFPPTSQGSVATDPAKLSPGSSPAPGTSGSRQPNRVPPPLEKQYMLAATGQDNYVRGGPGGFRIGSVPESQVTRVTADSESQKLLLSTGSVLFESPLDLTRDDLQVYRLSLSDRMRQDFYSAWTLGEDKGSKTSVASPYLRSASIAIKSSADKKTFGISGFKVEIAKDEKADALVFSSLLEVLNEQFEQKSSTAPALPPIATSKELSGKSSPANELSGQDRCPGHLLLGLAKDSGSGGFSTLADLCVLANITPKPWLAKLLLATKITLGTKDDRPSRNAMWYHPGKEARTWIRLEAQLGLRNEISDRLNKYFPHWSKDAPVFSVVAKRNHIASPGPWGSSYTSGQLVLVAELIPKALDVYVEFSEDEIHLILACYSTELQWDKLKTWLNENCSEVSQALDQLEKTLSTQGNDSDKSSNTSAPNRIYWRKVSVALRADDKENLKLVGLSLDLEASIQLLVPKEKHAVFTLGFAWDKAKNVFSGRCTFEGTGYVPTSSRNPPLHYLQNFERWSHMSYLTPSEEYMSLRHFDDDIMQHLPFGIPTELTWVDLYVSNVQLRFGGELKAIIKPPTATSTSVSDTKISPLQIQTTRLRVVAEFNYGKNDKSKRFNLSGEIGLEPLNVGDPPPTLEAMIEYTCPQGAKGALEFRARARDIPMTIFHSLFNAGDDRTQALAILEHIRLENVLVIYKSQEKKSQITFDATINVSGVILDTSFKRLEADTWTFDAKLQPRAVNAGQSPREIDLGAAVTKLLGPDVAAVLPDFVRGTKLKTSTTGQDCFNVVCKKIKGEKNLVFGAELKFGMLNVQFAQLALPVRDTRKSGAKASSDNKAKSPVKRLIRVSLGPLPSIPKLPLVGQLDIPFDSLEFLWLSSTMTKEDIGTLNTQVDMFAKQNIAVNEGDKEIVEGFHFRLVGNEKVFLDHIFNHEPEKTETTTTGGKSPAQSQSAAKTTTSSGASTGGGSPATTAPLTQKKGPLTLSGIALSYEGKVLRIHLDASVLIGPIGAGVQGLNLVLDLSKVSGLHDLLHVPIDVQIEGFDMSFDRKPVMLAGALHHKPGTKQYYGGVAISLTSFSIAALGMYDQIPASGNTPAYDSFFVYAMVEGLIFTVGWAEIRGIIAGFGYNSRLRLPTVDKLTDFPLIKGFQTPEGFNMHKAITSLTGPDAFVTPSMGSLWLALGLVIRACEAIDMRAVATVALGPDQTEIGLIARATASLPRGSKPSDALVVIDLSVVGKLDLIHGELSVDGQINPTSFILNKDCRPSGGFAIRTWFGKGNPHAGDWVVTFGGYHPMYQVPAHYPVPKRLGISWNLSDKLKITGNAYAAVTPGAIMAGGMLQAVFAAGSFGATFDAHADFLVNLKPLHYQADIAISAGVYYEIRKWILRKKFSVRVGASLHLEGPPIHGTVHFDLCVFSFDVSFGSGKAEKPREISLAELMELVVPDAAQNRTSDRKLPNAHTFTVISGLIGESTSTQDNKKKNPSEKKDPWIVRSDNFLLQVRSPVPVSTARVKGAQQSDTGNTIISRPMHMKKNGQDKIVTTLEVEVYRTNNRSQAIPFLRIDKVEDDLPANYWGWHADNPADYMRPATCPPKVKHLVGMVLQPPPAKRPTYSATVVKPTPLPYEATYWHPKDQETEATRYVDDNEARDSVKWSRVRGAMSIPSSEKIPVCELDELLDKPSAATSTTTTLQSSGPKKPKLRRSKDNKPRRQRILDYFVEVAHQVKDDQSKKIADAYRQIGASEPRVILEEPERFYVSPPTVFCH